MHLIEEMYNQCAILFSHAGDLALWFTTLAQTEICQRVTFFFVVARTRRSPKSLLF